MPLLDVHELTTHFHTREGVVRAVNGVSFRVEPGETIGIVGESGSGKTVASLSLLGLIPAPPGRIENGTALFDGVDLLACGPKTLRSIRGRAISMIFQDPMTALNPFMRVGDQLMEPLQVHQGLSRREARTRVEEMLRLVGIQDGARNLSAWPHEFSGGMRQRVMIAMALITRPHLLIADEPTTALDVTIQAEILRLIRRVQAETGMGVMYITHDLGVVANLADDVAVMYRGKIVERGTSRHIFKNALHPYTKALMESIPSFSGRRRGPLKSIPGTVGIPIDPPDECPFSNRCEFFIPGRCDQRMPPEIEVELGHSVACVLYED